MEFTLKSIAKKLQFYFSHATFGTFVEALSSNIKTKYIMKKQHLKSLQLNKKVISNFKNRSLSGGAANLTADVKDCPDNTLAADCGSLGACPVSFWCPPIKFSDSPNDCDHRTLQIVC